MKSKFVFTFFIFTTLALFHSCKPDETPAPVDARDACVGAWTCNEQSTQTGASTFTINIEKSNSATTQLQLSNFYNLGPAYKAIAQVNGNTITINQQTLNANQLHGSGNKSATNSINLTYYMNNGSTIDTCNSTLSRQ